MNKLDLCLYDRINDMAIMLKKFLLHNPHITGSDAIIQLLQNYDISIGQTFLYEHNGPVGVEVVFKVPEEVLELGHVIRNIHYLERVIKAELSKYNKCKNEYIEIVTLRVKKDLTKPQYNEKPEKDAVNIWKPGYRRLFISHLHEDKDEVISLAVILEKYKIDSFISHRSIEPMDDWQETIHKALNTMDVMLLFITGKVVNSPWVNQEVGVAIGKDIPVILVKDTETRVEGFIRGKQAIEINKNDINKTAENVYNAMIKLLEKNSGRW